MYTPSIHALIPRILINKQATTALYPVTVTTSPATSLRIFLFAFRDSTVRVIVHFEYDSQHHIQ